ncbi:MAG: hypothetical protein A2X94_00875 [Bdellovibrionales bacterium GWB1_55_8]|nr:MAG: hypothetical protein A2X94_00875 [Bdellovibrionales bacterium GWB1_55_8]
MFHVLLIFLQVALNGTQARAGDSDGSSDYLSAQVVGKSQEQLLRKLAEELSPAIKEFSRDVYVYHWGDCDYQNKNTPAFDANDEFALESVQRLILWTYRKDKNQGGNMGTSYYASTDPVATQHYGDCLTETRLPRKARFLDDRRHILFSQELRAQLQSAGCYAYALTSMFTTQNSDPCHQIVTSLLLVLRISAVAYPYGAAHSGSCEAAEHQGAFILVNPTLADQKYTKAFSVFHVPNDGQNETRSRIKGVAESFTRSWFDTLLWPDLPTSGSEEWIKDHLFGCNPDKYPEDKHVDPKATKALPDLDFAAKIPTWGVLPPIGDDCCNTIESSQPQDGIIRGRAAVDPVIQALLNSP